MKKIILLAFLLGSQAALAQERKFYPILQLGYETGTSGISIEGGLGYRYNNRRHETRALLGYQQFSEYTDVDTDDVSTPTLKIVHMYNINRKFAAGAGINVHIEPRSDTYSIDGEVGPMLQLEYKVLPRFAVGLSYTNMEHKLTKFCCTSASASTLGGACELQVVGLS